MKESIALLASIWVDFHIWISGNSVEEMSTVETIIGVLTLGLLFIGISALLVASLYVLLV